MLCLLVLSAALLGGCVTFTGARPLEPGEHQAGATVGGPMVVLGAPVPLPQVTLEGRSGLARPLDRPLDVNYGLGATALAFGIAQLHVGASWLLLDQLTKWAPALAITDRVFFATNYVSPADKVPGTRGVWGANQIELAASWALGQQLVYVSLAEYLDFGAPDLLLTPALGAQLDWGDPGGIALQFEGRWFAINKRTPIDTVQWWPDGRGALGVSIGVSYLFGKGGCGCDADGS